MWQEMSIINFWSWVKSFLEEPTYYCAVCGSELYWRSMMLAGEDVGWYICNHCEFSEYIEKKLAS